MLTVTITGPRSGPAVRPCFRTDAGDVFTFPWAPRDSQLAGWAPPVSTITRPGRKPLTVLDGDALETLSLTLKLARLDHQDPIEDQLAQLRRIGRSRDRVTVVGMSPLEQGPWRITALSVAGELRQEGSNVLTRATVTVELTEASDPSFKAGPVSGGGGGSNGKKHPAFYVVKKGDTLRSIAGAVYGDPACWQAIGKANGLKSAKVKVGKKLKLPTIAKGKTS